MTLLKYFCLLVSLTLWGPPVHADTVSVRLGSAPGFFLPAAADDLVSTFLGSGSTAKNTSLISVADAPVLWPGSGFEIALVYRAERWEQLFGEVRFGLGRSQFEAPDGLGVFRDPATARLRFATLDLRLGRHWTVREGGLGTLDFELAGGVALAAVESRLQSALLDVQAQSRVAEALLSASLTLSPRATLPALRAEIVHYGNGLTDVLVGFDLAF